MRQRIWAYGLLVAVVAAMLGPVLRSPPVDDFPLSTFPMFSSDRGERSSVATLVGVDESGEAHRLSPELIGGGDEPMLAVPTAGRAASAGGDAPLALCEQVAERIAGSDRSDLIEVVMRVEVHVAVDHFVDDAGPIEVRVLARCPVGP